MSQGIRRAPFLTFFMIVVFFVGFGLLVVGCWFDTFFLLPLPKPAQLPLILSAVSREIFFFWEVDSLKLKLKFYLSTVLSCVNKSKIVGKFVVLLSRCFVVWLLVCINIQLNN